MSLIYTVLNLYYLLPELYQFLFWLKLLLILQTLFLHLHQYFLIYIYFPVLHNRYHSISLYRIKKKIHLGFLQFLSFGISVLSVSKICMCSFSFLRAIFKFIINVSGGVTSILWKPFLHTARLFNQAFHSHNYLHVRRTLHMPL